MPSSRRVFALTRCFNNNEHENMPENAKNMRAYDRVTFVEQYLFDEVVCADPQLRRRESAVVRILSKVDQLLVLLGTENGDKITAAGLANGVRVVPVLGSREKDPLDYTRKKIKGAILQLSVDNTKNND